MRSHLTTLAATLALSVGGLASAQHAGFVLFGEPNPDAAVEPERQFVHPISAPYFAEDSFVTSDVRAVYIYHDFPNASLIDGGRAWVVAAQVRVALTDQLQLVAYKDGYVDFQTGLVDDSGLMDIAAGIKWNFLQNWEDDFHMAAGVGYEFDWGDSDVLQDDEELRLWLSANKGCGPWHFGGTFNVFFGEDKSGGLGDSDHISWHAHADYYACEWFSPVVEINGYHVFDEGTVVLPFQGVDVANFGGDDDEDVITIALAGEFRPWDNWALRLAYETPLTDADDLFGYRWTFSTVFSF